LADHQSVTIMFKKGQLEHLFGRKPKRVDRAKNNNGKARKKRR